MADERAASVVDKRLGERVRARRLAIGMSQEALADRLGITFQQVQKYEKGVNRIAVSRLLDIAEALDASVAEFVEGISSAKSQSAQTKLESALTKPGAVELVTLYGAVRNEKVRRRMLELVRAMAE